MTSPKRRTKKPNTTKSKTKSTTKSTKKADLVYEKIMALNTEPFPLLIKPEWVMMTPEMALECLTQNVENRKLSRSTVEDHKRRLLSGRWTPTTDTAGFDLDGKLINGQHRLTAIYETGISAPMGINFYMPRKSFVNTDRGKKRSIGDVLSIGKITNANQIASAAKMAIAILQWWSGGIKIQDTYRKIDTDEVLSWIRTNPDIALSVEKIRAWDPQRSMCNPQRMFAGAHFVVSKLNQEIADSFIYRFAKGRGWKNKELDDPAYALRNCLMRHKKQMTETQQIGVILKALKYDLEGKPLSVIRYSSETVPAKPNIDKILEAPTKSSLIGLVYRRVADNKIYKVINTFDGNIEILNKKYTKSRITLKLESFNSKYVRVHHEVSSDELDA